MPEGPEIRREADAISEAIEGQRATAVSFGLDHLRPFERLLSGDRVVRVSSRGKAMLVSFGGGLTMYSHNQLYGKWFVATRGQQPKTERSLRAAIHCETHSAFLYSASDIDVLPNEELPRHPYLSKLGPDILDPKLRPAAIAERMEQPRFRRRTLGVLLLDQGFLAGVGNYLRSEILFESRLHPDLRPEELDSTQRRSLGGAVRLISRRAYRQGGVTVAARLFERSRRAGEPRRQARFAVFDRDGRPCRACGRPVDRLMVAGRRLYLCSECQPSEPAVP
jgi:endonuclease-8